MNSSGWQVRPNGLAFREDDFSWQGTVGSDTHFFLRRDKYEAEKFTDVLLGHIDEALAAELFSEFILASGGVQGSIIDCVGVAGQDHAHDQVVERHDRTVRVCKLALEKLGFQTINSCLRQNASKWDSRIYIDKT